MNTAVKVMENVGVVLPAKYWGIFGLALMGLFLIGIDQGQTLSVFTGDVAYQQQFLFCRRAWATNQPADSRHARPSV